MFSSKSCKGTERLSFEALMRQIRRNTKGSRRVDKYNARETYRDSWKRTKKKTYGGGLDAQAV